MAQGRSPPNGRFYPGRPKWRTHRSLRGAGDGTRTHDIQLGKLTLALDSCPLMSAIVRSCPLMPVGGGGLDGRERTQWA